MSSNKYLIDSNSFITPYNQYYPFDFAPGFWVQLEENIKNGNIAILDMVKNEILQGDDDLTTWMSKLQIGEYIDHRSPAIIGAYGQILQYINDNPAYQPAALQEWSKETVADAWLIATAKVHGSILVSFETRNPGLGTGGRSKKAKIPDVADFFHVKTTDLFHMMRDLKFTL